MYQPTPKDPNGGEHDPSGPSEEESVAAVEAKLKAALADAVVREFAGTPLIGPKGPSAVVFGVTAADLNAGFRLLMDRIEVLTQQRDARAVGRLGTSADVFGPTTPATTVEEWGERLVREAWNQAGWYYKDPTGVTISSGRDEEMAADLVRCFVAAGPIPSE